MTRFAWMVVVVSVSACMVPEPETQETTQAGTSAQGTSAQGTSAQGTSAQGTSAQGTSAQGGTSGGVAVSDAKVVGTDLQFWKQRSDGYWLQYTATQLCVWGPLRFPRISCTSANLVTQPSPLAGSRWPTTFMRANKDGTKTLLHLQVQIGASSTDVNAVARDTTQAFFDLQASSATGAIVPCENPAGCRSNSDLFLYDVKVVDSDGKIGGLCPTGERAFALAGTWDGMGNYHASSTQFMFVCTNGTIAKCVRWGYRPWTSALRRQDASTATPTSLAAYHQSCVHAAMADYCGTGYSFTKDGTMIDISDEDFIPTTRSLVAHYTATTREAFFDQKGGYLIDQARYEELETTQPDHNIATECSGMFVVGGEFGEYQRIGDIDPPGVTVESGPACAHTELQLGKWLNKRCSACTALVPAHCTDPTDPTGWNYECVTAAQTSCRTVDRMSPLHGECRAGYGINKYGSACTLKLSSKGYASCFDETSSTAWSSACVAAANQYCTGGQEHTSSLGTYGFCDQPL